MQDDDTFNSIFTRILDKNESILKDRKLKSVYIVMDPNQLPVKMVSKLKVQLFISNQKISIFLNYIEVYYYTTNKMNIIKIKPISITSIIEKMK